MLKNSNIFLMRFIFILLILVLLQPIIEIEIFLILIFTITIIIFSKLRDKINYLKILISIFTIILIKFILSNFYFNEGNNILILNEKSKIFYKSYLPENLIIFLENEFKFYDQNSTCSDNDIKCWKSFDPTKMSEKETPFYFQYSPSMSLKQNKFSRKLKDLDIKNLKTAKITEVNNLKYNYHWGKKFDLVRENLPFFVMIEVPQVLLGSNICWKGNIFWEKNYSNFKHLKNDTYQCIQIIEKDINKKIYGVSFGKSETNERLNYLYGDDYIQDNDKLNNFLIKNELILKIEKKINLILIEYFLTFLIIFLLILIINFIFIFNFKIYICAFLSSSIFLFLTFYSDKDLFYGFTILTGGNDGIVYNSYANNIFYYLKNFNIKNFLLGSEKIFYFPSSIRYFLAIFKVIFNDSTYGYLMIGYLLCIIILTLFIKIFGLRFGLFFAFLIICTRLFEGYGASIIKLLKHINASDAEPFAITIFFLCFYIFIIIYENKDKKYNVMNFIFGFLSFVIISLRPNYLPTVFLLFLIHIYCLYFSYKYKEIFYSLLGISFITLIPIHNLYFGQQIVLLTTGYIHNTGAPLSIYFSAVIDVLNLNFNNSENINIINNQFKKWIKPQEIHYIIIFMLLFIVFRYKNFYFKIISSLALSQHAVLLVFVPTGRYSYLAWFLNIMVFLFILQKIIEFFSSRRNLA